VAFAHRMRITSAGGVVCCKMDGRKHAAYTVRKKMARGIENHQNAESVSKAANGKTSLEEKKQARESSQPAKRCPGKELRRDEKKNKDREDHDKDDKRGGGRRL